MKLFPLLKELQTSLLQFIARLSALFIQCHIPFSFLSKLIEFLLSTNDLLYCLQNVARNPNVIPRYLNTVAAPACKRRLKTIIKSDDQYFSLGIDGSTDKSKKIVSAYVVRYFNAGNYFFISLFSCCENKRYNFSIGKIQDRFLKLKHEISLKAEDIAAGVNSVIGMILNILYFFCLS